MGLPDGAPSASFGGQSGLKEVPANLFQNDVLENISEIEEELADMRGTLQQVVEEQQRQQRQRPPIYAPDPLEMLGDHRSPSPWGSYPHHPHRDAVLPEHMHGWSAPRPVMMVPYPPYPPVYAAPAHPGFPQPFSIAIPYPYPTHYAPPRGNMPHPAPLAPSQQRYDGGEELDETDEGDSADTDEVEDLTHGQHGHAYQPPPQPVQPQQRAGAFVPSKTSAFQPANFRR